MQDYNYLNGNCLEITMELSCCKYPPASELHKEWDLNRESLLAYIEKVYLITKKNSNDTTTFITTHLLFFFCLFKRIMPQSNPANAAVQQAGLDIYYTAVFQVHIGVRGYVKDAISGAALTNVSIVVVGIKHNLTTAKYGDYYRLLLPGTYNITAVAPGWVIPIELSLQWPCWFLPGRSEQSLMNKSPQVLHWTKNAHHHYFLLRVTD